MILDIGYFLGALVISFFLTLLTKRFATRWHVVDEPAVDPSRKFHQHAVPLLGGWPLVITINVCIVLALVTTELLNTSFLSNRQILGIVLASFCVVIGGTLDDIKRLKPGLQLLFPACAALLLVAFGIGIDFITNPFGGVIMLNQHSIRLFSLSGIPYSLTLFGDLFVFIWMMVVMYSTKLLDGLDGLSTGVGTIGAFMIFFLSLTKTVSQPGTALLAIIIAGAFAGFLLLNKAPAKIFLGEAGSLLVGFYLGLLAIISGGKIATALLILALPVLDVVFVVLTRLFRGQNIFKADRSHLHFRLRDKGLSQNQVVFIYYVITLFFGVSALFIQTSLKFLFIILALFTSLGLLFFALKNPHGKTKPLDPQIH